MPPVAIMIVYIIYRNPVLIYTKIYVFMHEIVQLGLPINDLKAHFVREGHFL